MKTLSALAILILVSITTILLAHIRLCKLQLAQQEKLWRVNFETLEASHMEPPVRNRTLVVYAFTESSTSCEPSKNLDFFLSQAFEGVPEPTADFVFVIAGRRPRVQFPNATNIFMIYRENSCFEIGNWEIGYEMARDRKWLVSTNLTPQEQSPPYKYFIFVSPCVRGPFMPVWERQRNWIQVLTERIQDRVHLVGTWFDCSLPSTTRRTPVAYLPGTVLAMDKVGMQAVRPLFTCKKTASEASESVVQVTLTARSAGLDVDALHVENDTSVLSSVCVRSDGRLNLVPRVFHPFEAMWIESSKLRMTDLSKNYSLQLSNNRIRRLYGSLTPGREPPAPPQPELEPVRVVTLAGKVIYVQRRQQP